MNLPSKDFKAEKSTKEKNVLIKCLFLKKTKKQDFEVVTFEILHKLASRSKK